MVMVSSMRIRPAIDAGSSVSRVIGSAQIKSHEEKLLVHSVSTAIHTVSWKPSLSLVLTWMQQQAKLNRGRRTVESIETTCS